MVDLAHSTCGNILFGSLNTALLCRFRFIHDPSDCPNQDTETRKHLPQNELASTPARPVLGHTPAGGQGPRRQLNICRGSGGRFAVDALGGGCIGRPLHNKGQLPSAGPSIAAIRSFSGQSDRFRSAAVSLGEGHRFSAGLCGRSPGIGPRTPDGKEVAIERRSTSNVLWVLVGCSAT